jgi:predicted metal-dependent phosphoesterase TrpH
VIDLHTHTTASDGRCSPDELVARAAATGVSVLGLTDHDTVAGCGPASLACERAGLEFVAGVEITAVASERDVHVLAYFFDPASTLIHAFLAVQRRYRLDRLREVIARLRSCGIHLDADAILAPGLIDDARAVGRPMIARAMIAAGHVLTVNEAFDRWLGRGRPAFVPRRGASPAEVIEIVHGAGGIASLAHPVLIRNDAQIPPLIDAGLDAIEAYHSDHSEADTTRYLSLARSSNLLVTGGSDYHADSEHGGGGPGSVSLPRPEYERLKARAAR